MRYILIILIFLVLCSFLYAEDMFIDDTLSTGNDDGTSAANAWQAEASIAWGTSAGEVGPGDTLYILNRLNDKLEVDTSGTSGNPITIRGDWPGTSGNIDHNSTALPLGAGDDWVVVGGKATYEWQTAAPANTVISVYNEGVRFTFVEWDTDAATTADIMDAIATVNTFAFDETNDKLYVHLTDDTDPDGLVSADFRVTKNHGTGIAIADQNYITVKNLTLQKITGTAIFVSATDDVLVTDVIVDNCTITSATLFGVYYENSNDDTANKMLNCIIRNCTISDTGRSAISTTNGTDGFIIERNNCTTSGWQALSNQISISSSGAGKPSVNSIIRNNTTYGAISFQYAQDTLDGTALDGTELDGNGIMLDNYSEDALCEYNDCYDNQGYGIRVSDNSDGHTIRHNRCWDNGQEANDTGNAAGIGAFDFDGITIEYNSCYGNYAGLSLRKMDAGTAIVRYNIFSSSDTYDIRTNTTTVTPYIFSNNCYYNGSVANNFYELAAPAEFATIALWQAEISSDYGSIEADPQFADTTNDNFHLLKSSPCTGIGRYPWEKGRRSRYIQGPGNNVNNVKSRRF